MLIDGYSMVIHGYTWLPGLEHVIIYLFWGYLAWSYPGELRLTAHPNSLRTWYWWSNHLPGRTNQHVSLPTWLSNMTTIMTTIGSGCGQIAGADWWCCWWLISCGWGRLIFVQSYMVNLDEHGPTAGDWWLTFKGDDGSGWEWLVTKMLKLIAPTVLDDHG